jgi:GTP:adenosylcobinamide-phosphate guanylyltransferase
MDSIRDSFEPAAKLIDVRNFQTRKAPSKMTLTEAGISIEMKPLSQKMLSLIRDNCESASSVNDVRDLQKKEHSAQISKRSRAFYRRISMGTIVILRFLWNLRE